MEIARHEFVQLLFCVLEAVSDDGHHFFGSEDHERYQSAGYVYEARNMPVILQTRDVLVRVHKTTICGTDLNILGGNVPGARPGLGLGHEGIGDIVGVGSAVQKWKVGDRVLCSCNSACGTCQMCAAQRFGNCKNEEGGWVLGHTLDGMQSEFARVPFADTSCFRLPEKVEGSGEDRYFDACRHLAHSVRNRWTARWRMARLWPWSASGPLGWRASSLPRPCTKRQRLWP